MQQLCRRLTSQSTIARLRAHWQEERTPAVLHYDLGDAEALVEDATSTRQTTQQPRAAAQEEDLQRLALPSDIPM